MSIVSHPDEPERGRASPVAESEQAVLRHLVRRQLDRHRPRAQRSGLSVLGVRAGSVRLLRHANERVADAVIGFSLPLEFSAVITVAESVVTTESSRFDEADLAVAVSRSGVELCMLGTAGEVGETGDPRGWLIDACRRAVALPTPRCDEHPLMLPLAAWLDRLMVVLVRASPPLTWAEAALRCPVPRAWQTDRARHLGATLASVTPTWAALRRQAASGVPILVPIDAHVAAWMDDAMFARWCLGMFPDLAELRSDLAFMAPDDVVDGVEAVIAAAFAAWPD